MSKVRDLLRDLELCEKATRGPWKVDRNPENLATVSAFYLLERHGGAAYIDDCLQINGNADYTGETYDPVFVAAVYDRYNADNATFVAEAREGWPHAIERALKAETLLRDILPMAMWVSCMYKNEPEANPNIHCCIWNEVVKRIQEVLGDE